MACYAAATAWVIALERKQPGMIAKVTQQAAQADQMDSAAIVAVLSKPASKDCQVELGAFRREKAAEILEVVISNLERDVPWAAQ